MKRHEFLKLALGIASTSMFRLPAMASVFSVMKKHVPVGAHVWVYAQYQPGYDVSHVLPQIFSDMKYAGMDGVETMHQPLRKQETTKLIAELIGEHQLPLIGTSYGEQLWDRSRYQKILEDVENIMGNLEKVKGRTFGVSVGKPRGRKKTEDELDTQAELLKQLIAMGESKGIVLNLHNHTYEVADNLFDLKGTLKRIPDAKLGPDLNWLLRAGVDPVNFLKEYRNNIVFMHLRDQLENGKWPESVGEGDVDFEEIGNTLDEISFNGDLIIELAFEDGFKPTRPTRESLKMSRKYVRKTMGY